jgi:hypothetical protein
MYIQSSCKQLQFLIEKLLLIINAWTAECDRLGFFTAITGVG